MKYAKGDEVVWLHDGQEIPATVVNCGKDHQEVEFYQIDVDGQKKHVKVNDILPLKKPGFEVRDLVLVLDENRDTIKGEIIQAGEGPKGRKFYQVKFTPETNRAVSWHSEDEVFIISKPKKHTTPRVSLL